MSTRGNLLPHMAAVMTAALLLAGCAKRIDYASLNAETECTESARLQTSSEADVSLNLVLAPSQGFTNVQTLAPFIRGAIDRFSDSATTIRGVMASGTPHLASVASFDISSNVFSTNSSRAVSAAVNETLMAAQCAEGPAGGQVPELDLLSAIALSASSTNQSGTAKQKTMAVFSNGLQTQGDFDLRTDFALEPANIARQLADRGALPNLSGWKVVFFGLGQTAQEYPTLAQKSQNQLASIWRAIVEKSGGDFENGGPVILGQSNTSGIFVSSVNGLFTAPLLRNCGGTLTDENVSFEPDSAVFSNATQARVVIKNLIDQASENSCGQHYSVVGFTTNFGLISKQKELSKARAKAVAALIAESAPRAVVDVLGKGYDGSGDLSQSNRRVEIQISN